MNWLLYMIGSALVGTIQAFPVTWVARFGRAVGGLVYLLDKRHRNVAVRNLTEAFGKEKSAAEIQAIARENFRRIGENFACAVKTCSMSAEKLRPHVEFVGVDKVALKKQPGKSDSRIIAIGHFGNFELYGRASLAVPEYQSATTYRALRQEGLNRVLLRLRNQTGCLYFERRAEGAALRTAMRDQTIMLGLLSDQHSGDHGLRIPFFGRDCTTTKAPAVFALRFELPLNTSFCYRVRPGYWRIEVGDEIPTHENGEPRSPEAIMRDVNRAFEEAVRRDPANWFWVHNRWKVRKKPVAAAAPVADPDFELGQGGEDGLAEKK